MTNRAHRIWTDRVASLGGVLEPFIQRAAGYDASLAVASLAFAHEVDCLHREHDAATDEQPLADAFCIRGGLGGGVLHPPPRLIGLTGELLAVACRRRR